MTKIVAFLCLLIPSTVFSATCGTCSGCAPIMPSIMEAAEDIVDRYDEMEKTISAKYKDDILPLEEELKKLEKEVMKEFAYVHALERKILFYQKAITFETESVKGLELTRSSIRKQNKQTNNKGNKQ